MRCLLVAPGSPVEGLIRHSNFYLGISVSPDRLHAEALRSTRETVLAACGREVPAAASFTAQLLVRIMHLNAGGYAGEPIA